MGTLVNVIAVLVGGTLGWLLGDRLPHRTRETVVSGLGLMTLVVGLQMALSTKQVLIPLLSLLIGAVLGEALNIELRLEHLGTWFEKRMRRDTQADPSQSVARAFVTASLVFCVGPMSILGAIEDGLRGVWHLLAIKSVLDGFSAMAFAASLGPGVLLSALTVAFYQGAITLAAVLLATHLGAVTPEAPAIVEMTATGGVLIMGIGLSLLELRRVRVGNLLPAVFIAQLLVWLLSRLGITWS